jgi:hypothetical protein
LLALAGLCGCAPDSPAPSEAPGETALFVECAASVGLDFRHDAGARGGFLFPEIMGGGGALLDFDRDGDLDVYVVQSGDLTADAAQRPGNQLFLNRFADEGELKFIDVTSQSGTGDRGYGMGAAVGDIDRDGWPDLYVTNVGANRLLRNNGDGSFSDVTDAWGADDERWSTSASFLDFDSDGDDDLMIVNYVQYSASGNVACLNQAGASDYCAPATYRPAPDRLLRNDGDRYVDVTHVAGIDTAYGNGLGVAVADVNGDGRLDIYVANDQTPNNLWLGRADGRFDEAALMAGVAYNEAGAAEASMGVTAADVDGDSDIDLFLTHLRGETNTLYLNVGGGQFVDATARYGLASSSLPRTGFGTRFFDADTDGDLDLFIANGAVTIDPARIGTGDYPFGEADQLFLQREDGRFYDASVRLGTTTESVGRGALFGDLDNDGDTDIVVVTNNGPLEFLRNVAPRAGAWLGLRLESATGGALRARVTGLDQTFGRQWRDAGRDGSYLSSGDPRVILPVSGAHADVGVVWQDGTRESWVGLATNRYHVLRRGGGLPWPEN